MRSLALLAFFPLMMMTPALAQDPASTRNQPQSSSGDAQTIQQQVQNNLQQAGFTDIQMMPSSFLVRAKDSAGNPVIMVISPDSVTAVTEITAPIAGQPGNKSGPSANSSASTMGSATASPAQAPSGQDAAKVPGLPGSKSGPAGRSPASTSK